MTTTPQRQPEPETRPKKPIVGAICAALCASFAGLSIPVEADGPIEPMPLALGPPMLKLPIWQNADIATLAALNGPMECVDDVDPTQLAVPIDACMGPGSYCVPEGDDVWRCTIYCWRWTNGMGETECSYDHRADRVYSSVGIFYCPPPGVDRECDENGWPTDGLLFVEGYHSDYGACSQYGGDECPYSDLDNPAWGWAPQFQNGVMVNSNDGPQSFSGYARSIRADVSSGTYGGFFEFYVEGP